MALSEKRTQIYLPNKLFEPLQKEARAEHKSIAQVVREAVAVYLEERKAKKIDWEKDPLHKLIGGAKADKDLAARHDKYIYGEKKK